MVCPVASETGRFTQFWVDYGRLIFPPNTLAGPAIGGTLGNARQRCVEEFLQTDASWLFMIDDDHLIRPDHIMRMLARDPVPILGSLYVNRDAPFRPSVYGAPVYDARGQVDSFEGLFLDDLPTTGVVPVYAVGASGMLVRRQVFEGMTPPWFRLGQMDAIGEDMAFCHVAYQAGFRTYLDVEARLDHASIFTVAPDLQDGQWVTRITRGACHLATKAAYLP